MSYLHLLKAKAKAKLTKQKVDDMKTGIHIGVSKKVVKGISKAIIAILSSGAEQKTMRAALATLKESTQVNNSMITNCVFTDGKTEEESNG